MDKVRRAIQQWASKVICITHEHIHTLMHHEIPSGLAPALYQPGDLFPKTTLFYIFLEKHKRVTQNFCIFWICSPISSPFEDCPGFFFKFSLCLVYSAPRSQLSKPTLTGRSHYLAARYAIYDVASHQSDNQKYFSFAWFFAVKLYSLTKCRD